MAKTEQLQRRVSPEEKLRIRRAAERAGVDMSEWIMSRLFSKRADEFERLTSALRETEKPTYVFAALHDFLADMDPAHLAEAVAHKPEGLSPFHANYVAAMVEHAAHMKDVEPPDWIAEIKPLDDPVFGSELQSLRLYLLTQSPPAFRRRNIFIGPSIGGRV